MFCVYIFLVTKCPAHPVELHYVEIPTYLRLKMQNSVKFKVGSTKEQGFSCLQMLSRRLLRAFKTSSLQDVRCKRDVIKCLIFIQVRAYERKARKQRETKQFPGSVLSNFYKMHVCRAFAAC